MTLLQVLDLSRNRFNGTIQNDLSHLCNLKTIDFSYNSLQGDIHKLFENSSSSLCFKNNKLETLSLSYNNLSGYAPNWLTKLKNLGDLDLGFNSFVGPIPPSIWKSSSLRYVDLSYNKFIGSIPDSLGQLSHLEKLYLNHNSFEGVITDVHFANLSALKILHLSSNSFSLKIRSDWIPPFQLHQIELGSCKMGHDLPMWLQTQKSFSRLNISNANIIGYVPKWLFNFSFPYSPLVRGVTIDISFNQFHGKVPNFFSSIDVASNFFLQHNNFEGPLPHFPSNVVAIGLCHNSFSGPIHENIGDMYPNLSHLTISNNSLSGGIPYSLCKMKSLRTLDLSKNHLFGSLPHCWSGLQSLHVLDLSITNISGIIPSSIGELVELEFLHLNRNEIYGKVPLSLINCTKLKVFLYWRKQTVRKCSYMDWRKLVQFENPKVAPGTIPLQLCNLSNLQLLDLSHNNISGTIPRCFENFRGMIEHPSLYRWNVDLENYNEKIEVIVKWQILEYSKTISLVTGLHMSINNLVGEVPEELTTLVALRILDLSKNKLRGSIPEKIYDMTSLEYLYLDENKLRGSIPQSMTALTSLSHLNLSYNNFSGKIPSGNQFSTFNDPSSFIGNPDLCGAPLKSCPIDSSVDIVMPKIDEDGTIEMNWFYIGLAS